MPKKETPKNIYIPLNINRTIKRTDKTSPTQKPNFSVNLYDWAKEHITLVVEGTYAQLETLKNASQLKVGKWYKHTDFATTYDIPDYEEIGGNIVPKTTIVTRTHDVVEPLLLLAATTSEFYLVAISTLHPDHYIEFDFNYNSTYVNTAPVKGRITKRIDEFNNEVDYDLIGVKFKRYEDANGIFSVYYDNGNASKLLNTFGDDYRNGGVIKDNKIGNYTQYASDFGQPFDLSNNVFNSGFTVVNIFGSLCFNNTFGDDISSNTFGNQIFSNTFGNEIFSNTFGDGIISNTFGGSIDSNTFGNEIYSNTFGNDINSNTFGNDIISNTFGNDINSNTFGNDIELNTFGGSIDSNTFGNDINSNTFGDSIDLNTFGDGINSNTFGNAISSNTFENTIISNTFGDSIISNIFGNTITSNTFGNTITSNTFGNFIDSNTFGDGIISNTFGDKIDSNIFGVNISRNTFGVNIGSNTFGNQIFSNTFGDTIGSNIFGNDIGPNTFGNQIFSNTFDLTQPISNKIFGNDIQNKDFENEAYIYNNNYEVRIFIASDNEVYAQYFDGTNTITNLIPNI